MRIHSTNRRDPVYRSKHFVSTIVVEYPNGTPNSTLRGILVIIVTTFRKYKRGTGRGVVLSPNLVETIVEEGETGTVRSQDKSRHCVFPFTRL